MHILALSGSLRSQSLNSLLLQEAVRLAPPGLELSRWEHLDDLPKIEALLKVARELEKS